MRPVAPIEVIILAALILLPLAVYFTWKSTARCRPKIRILSTICRLLTFTALIILALNPGTWQEQRHQKSGQWAILIDRSASMQTTDAGPDKTTSRFDEALRLAQAGLALAPDPDAVRIFTFDSDLTPASLDSLPALTPGDATTDIENSGRALLSQFSSANAITGAIILTDGRVPGADPLTKSPFALQARASEAKLFPLSIGGDVPVTDLEVTPARRRYIAFPGQKIRVRADVNSHGLGKIKTDIHLINTSQSQTLTFTQDGTQSAIFEITAGSPGYSEFQLQAAPLPGERSISNNTATFGVQVIDGKIRVFTAEGVPYWDSKFLVQLLRNEPNIDVTSVYRLSADRFFKVETDPANAAEFDAVEAAFPDTIEALSAYDVLVFGKGTEYFLDAKRLALIKQFVRDRGGAVLFARGKPYNGEFEAIEFLEPVTWGEETGSPFSFQPTAAGGEAGLFGDMLAAPTDPLWAQLPPLTDAHQVRQIKSFSQTLVEGVSSGSRPFPAVISRRYGKGISLVVNADGMWKWDFFPSVENAHSMYQEFWTQILQWAVTYSDFLPGQDYALRLSSTITEPGTPVRATILHRNPAPGAPNPTLTFAGRTIPANPAGNSLSGQWETLIMPDAPGDFRIEINTGQDSNNQPPAALLQVNAPPGENDQLSADPGYLEKIALASSGRLITEQTLADAIKELDPKLRKVDLAKAIWQPSWDRGPLLCLLIFFPGLEWFLRRRNGLL